jgi:hypothetical protein
MKTEIAAQPLLRSETQPAVPQGSGETGEVDGFEMLGHDEIVALSRLIPNEQILAMRAFDPFPSQDRFGDREDRRVFVSDVRNPQAVQNFINPAFPFFHRFYPNRPRP